MYDELVKRLRDAAKMSDALAVLLPHSEGNATAKLYNEAADAIEELANKLCDWCGVCPKERRSPWDCEIMWPNAPTTEVYIEPPKEET